MSSNANDTITLGNYEEWFILYVDNELSADEQAMVENFLLLHPLLCGELDLLLSTRLPADELCFAGKEELMAASMKLNAVDESLLLYIDNELAATERKAVEAKLAADGSFHLQHHLLRQTKLDATQLIPYPNKAELYRYSKRAVFLPMWLRIAAVVAVLFFSAFFFLLHKENAPTGLVAVEQRNRPAIPVNALPGAKKAATLPGLSSPHTDKASAGSEEKPFAKAEKKTVPVLPVNNKTALPLTPPEPVEATARLTQIPAERIAVDRMATSPAVALNIPLTTSAVTSARPVAYNDQIIPEVTAGTKGIEKSNRTPAKGFLRKVSRFLERRTGIGTVNADNELLVGAVALKLN